MTDTRLILAVLPLALLAACNDEVADDGRAASGEVLEGSISDAMLPVDRITSEPPFEDPEAFLEAQENAADAAAEAGQATGAAEGEEAEAPEGEAAAEPAAEPVAEPAD